MDLFTMRAAWLGAGLLLVMDATGEMMLRPSVRNVVYLGFALGVGVLTVATVPLIPRPYPRRPPCP